MDRLGLFLCQQLQEDAPCGKIVRFQKALSKKRDIFPLNILVHA